MGRKKNDIRTERWIVRDDGDLLHEALVSRHIEPDGTCRRFYYSTACAPSVMCLEAQEGQAWSGFFLPRTAVRGNFTIVEWKVREEATCLTCIALADAFT